MEGFLEKVKTNLVLEHDADDVFIGSLINVAVSYAERYQKKGDGYYTENPMLPTTEQAVIMLASHLYESRDGSTGGFFMDSVPASDQVWKVVNLLLKLDGEVVI